MKKLARGLLLSLFSSGEKVASRPEERKVRRDHLI